MKITWGIIFLVLFFPSVAKCQAAPEIASIEVLKSSRGYSEEIRITPDSVFTFRENRIDGAIPFRQGSPLPEGSWQKLVKTLSNIDLGELGRLPSPTMNRASDAAMHSSIRITTATGQTYSHGYDDENPHHVLKPLLEMVRFITGPSKP